MHTHKEHTHKEHTDNTRTTHKHHRTSIKGVNALLRPSILNNSICLLTNTIDLDEGSERIRPPGCL
jgi:hypothetical protein